MVSHAKAHNIKPLEFPYAEARRIFREALKEYTEVAELQMSEPEFRSALDPVAIVQNRRTVGGPQEPEMRRMLALSRQGLAEQSQWISARRAAIDNALATLNQDFTRLLKP